MAEIKPHHTPEQRRIIEEYNASVDKSILEFIKDVKENRDVIPVTVGFITSKAAEDIERLTGMNVSGNRIVMTADKARHILKRHGINGIHDHSLANDEDIARISYVLANYDSIEWNGECSSDYMTKDNKPAPQVTIRKRINGEYYIIEIVSDSSKERNVLCSAWLRKAE